MREHVIATPEIDRRVSGRVSESVIAVEAARHLSPSGKADLVALRPAPHGAGNVIGGIVLDGGGDVRIGRINSFMMLSFPRVISPLRESISREVAK